MILQKKNLPKILRILKSNYKNQTMLGDFRSKGYTPFKILIATILSPRSKDEVTIPISNNLFEIYPTAKKLANAKPRDVQKIIKKSGFFRNKSKFVIETAKKLIDEFEGKVPTNRPDLVSLPGVGQKVANCVLVYAFNQDFIPVDIHVHRISNRLGWVETKNPNKTEIALEKIIPKKYWTIVNEVLVLHGQNICKPITPICSKCPVFKYCERINVKQYK